MHMARCHFFVHCAPVSHTQHSETHNSVGTWGEAESRGGRPLHFDPVRQLSTLKKGENLSLWVNWRATDFSKLHQTTNYTSSIHEERICFLYSLGRINCFYNSSTTDYPASKIILHVVTITIQSFSTPLNGGWLNPKLKKLRCQRIYWTVQALLWNNIVASLVI